MADILADWERRVLKAAVDILELECTDPHSIPDPTTLQTFVDLRDYVSATYFEAYLEEMLAITTAALINVSNNLVQAHNQAASIVAQPPTQGDIQTLVSELQALNGDIQKQEKLQMAVQLSTGISNVLVARLKAS